DPHRQHRPKDPWNDGEIHGRCLCHLQVIFKEESVCVITPGSSGRKVYITGRPAQNRSVVDTDNHTDHGLPPTDTFGPFRKATEGQQWRSLESVPDGIIKNSNGIPADNS